MSKKSLFCKLKMDDSDREELTVSLNDGTHVISIPKSVVERSLSVLSNVIKFGDVDVYPDNPIKPKDFITKAMLLDFLEIIEKEDYECANLVLCSNNYLIDFLKAVDFLGDEKVINGVEDRIKDRINGDTWRDFFDLTVDVYGLNNITNAALKCFNDIGSVLEDYEELSSSKLEWILDSIPEGKSGTKIQILQNWLMKNADKVSKEELCILLKCFCYEASALSDDDVKLLGNVVNSWSLSLEQKEDLEKYSWDWLRTLVERKVCNEPVSPRHLEGVFHLFYPPKIVFRELLVEAQTQRKNHPLRLLNQGYFPFLNQEILNDVRRTVENKVTEEIQKANAKNNNDTATGDWDNLRGIVQKYIVTDNIDALKWFDLRDDDGIKINLHEDEAGKRFCELVENVAEDEASWRQLQEIILENIPDM